MSTLVNPYIAGNPVTGTEMFFGRQDIFTFVQQALIGQHRDNVIVLYGQRRTGKTSVLYQMHRHLDSRYLCIFVDLHGLALDGLSGFLWELANIMGRSLRKDYRIELPPLGARAGFLTDARNAFENDFLPQIWSAVGNRHVLLMLDEAIRLQEQIQAGKLEKEVFEYLRHLMQHYEQLNFLFSLGSGLEEMEKEYAFLFNVGLYKKISFLERDAAIELITRPASDHYQLTPNAIDRILQITSGHAYYTQLLCHSLFNRWQRNHKSPITNKDVETSLDEVVERGLAVLKHVWEESTPGEKAVLAGLSTSMGNHNQPVRVSEVNSVWQRLNVALPESERARAIKSLIARDVIGGSDRYKFAIDLQRLWVQKYERLEWVKEEIAEDIQRWRTEPRTPVVHPSFWRSRTGLVILGTVLGLISLGGLLGMIYMRSQQSSLGTAGTIPVETVPAQTIPFGSPNDPTLLNSVFGWQPGNSPINAYDVGSQPNALTLITGGHTDQWGELDSQPLIFYSIEGDFETQVKVVFFPGRGHEFAALGVRSIQDHLTWLRLGIGGNPEQIVGLDVNEQGRGNKIRISPYSDNTVYFKIERRGPVFNFLYGPDGIHWTVFQQGYVAEMSASVEIFLTVGSWETGGASAQFYDFKASSK